jgi:ABC-2 type transport system permease protein
MLSFHAIIALALRHARLLRRDANYLLSMFYWPLLDVLIWGFLGSYIQNVQTNGYQNYTAVALLCIILWRTTSTSAIVTARAFVEELWSHNLINIVSLPLTLTEWFAGITLYNTLMSCATAVYCTLLIMFFYGLSPALIFGKFVLFAPPLFLSGLALGTLCLAIIAYCGKRAEELLYVFAWFFAPFSAAFYPREILPGWAQMISDALPMSYIFTGLRVSMLSEGDPTPYLIKGYLMAIAYLIIALLAFVFAFHKSKNRGLARLSD